MDQNIKIVLVFNKVASGGVNKLQTFYLL